MTLIAEFDAIIDQTGHNRPYKVGVAQNGREAPRRQFQSQRHVFVLGGGLGQADGLVNEPIHVLDDTAALQYRFLNFTSAQFDQQRQVLNHAAEASRPGEHSVQEGSQFVNTDLGGISFQDVHVCQFGEANQGGEGRAQFVVEDVENAVLDGL